MATNTSVSVEERLDRIENTLNSIAAGLNQAPVMLSMATDSIDEVVGNARKDGIYLEERLQNGLDLLKRLSDPEINKTINGLIDTLEMAPGLISMTMDIADETAKTANDGCVRLQDRIDGLTSLLEKVSNPSTIESLNKLIDLSEQGPGLVSMAMDTFDDLMARNKIVDRELIELFKDGMESVHAANHDRFPEKVSGIFGF